MKCIDVVAGIIFDTRRKQVLVALRKPEQHQGDRWEFPGGKMEAHEAQTDALARELLEEIDLRVDSSVHRCTLEHQYSDKRVRLHFWDVTDYTGTPRGVEGQELQWVDIEELLALKFPDANQIVVDELVEQFSVNTL